MFTNSINPLDSSQFLIGDSTPVCEDSFVNAPSPLQKIKPNLDQAIHKSDEVFTSSKSLNSSSSVNSPHSVSAHDLSSPITPPILDEATVTSMTSGVEQSLSSQHVDKTSSPRPTPSEVLNYTKKGVRYNTPEGQEAYIKESKEGVLFKRQCAKIGYDEAYQSLLKRVPTAGERLIIKSGVGEAVSEVTSYLDDKGVLSFIIRTVSSDGKYRGPIPGKVLFDEMMSFHGDSVKVIEANWAYETNLKTFISEVELCENRFRQETQRNPDENELNTIYRAAAKATWTGSQAERLGFSHVKSVTFENNDDKSSGLTVLFTRS